jgi:uncharacterized protein (DUF3084 family)
MPGRLLDPEYWRSRAEEAHAQANEMRDAKVKQTLLEIAKNYDQIAEQQERSAQRASKPET